MSDISPKSSPPLHPAESVRRFTSLKVGVLLLLILGLTLFGIQREAGQSTPPAASGAQSVTFPMANDLGKKSLVDAESALQPATGNAMIELPGPPAFSILSDEAQGIRLKGSVPDSHARDQWMNAARLGARDTAVSGSLQLGRIDTDAASAWAEQLTALVALVRERGVSEVRVRGDAVELFGLVSSPAHSDETLKLFRNLLPEGYRLLARFNIQGAQPRGDLDLVGENRDNRPLASAADVIKTTPLPQTGKKVASEKGGSRKRPANCPKSVRSLAGPVYFRTNASALETADRKRLRQLGACLNRYARLRVTGYSDPRHTAAYNKSLSERRARAVASGIVEGGFPASRITVLGAGQTKEKSRSEKSLKRSRRVDIRIN